ncbi:MAG: hypothetical protein KKD92_06420 [Proteobacteria bacterium]|nr:hypothetical protein [Pseudomonadota bacterium]
MKAALTSITLAVMLWGCATTPSQPKLTRPGDIGHHDSSIVFPEAIGAFRRGEVRTYDAKGRDMSAGYNLTDPRNTIVITVYVYPGPKLISIGSPANVVDTARRRLTGTHFDVIKAEHIKYHPWASLVSEHESALEFRGQSLYGRTAVFKSEELFAYRIQPIVTQAEVYAYGKWIIKFFTTNPAASQGVSVKFIQAFKEEFRRTNE